MENEDNHVIQSICKTEAENPDNWLGWLGLLRELSSRYATGSKLRITSPVQHRERNIFSQREASAASYDAADIRRADLF